MSKNRFLKHNLYLLVFFSALFFLFAPLVAGALSIGDEVNFNIDAFYDLQDRKEILATFVKTSNRLHFYADSDWWQGLSQSEKQNLNTAFHNLSTEFEKNIHPQLTSIFGPEAQFGIDGEVKTTVLLHPMVAEAGGYFSSGDAYAKLQYPRSNERKIIYLNSQHIAEPEASYFLAHEFMHLITVNQKDLLRGVAEEIWLNEARAEYTATLLGYDDAYKGSNLESRVKDFLGNPRTSLTEWLNRKEDYGAVNLFIHYLVDHYGVKILADSLQSDKAGIESINYALKKNNYNKDFTQAFSDWLIALLVNNCSLGEKYCYLNENLKDLRINPTPYFLPKTTTVLSTHHVSGPWAPNWHRFVGGSKHFLLEFDGSGSASFKIPYVLCDFNNSCSVSFISLDKEQKGELAFSEFSAKHASLTIMPFIDYKTAGFNGRESFFDFSWEVVVKEITDQEREVALIEQLLAQIKELERKIAEYQAKIAAILAERGQISCQRIERDLSFGMRDSAEVRCLQEFLKSQGTAVYPEGLVTGSFLSLTQKAVIRFQEQHAENILAPLGLQKGTGYVGASTRTKINQLLGQLL